MTVYTYSYGNVEQIATGNAEPFLSFQDLEEQVEKIIPPPGYFGVYQEGCEVSAKNEAERELEARKEFVAKIHSLENMINGKLPTISTLVCVSYADFLSEKKLKSDFRGYDTERLRIVPYSSLGTINFEQKPIQKLGLENLKAIHNSRSCSHELVQFAGIQAQYGLSQSEARDLMVLKELKAYAEQMKKYSV